MSKMRVNSVESLDGQSVATVTDLATINQRAIYVDSVTELEALSVSVGANVKTLGYYTPGDGGGNDYEIVAGGTGTADGGSFIDLNNGLQANGLFPGGYVNVFQFGAKGDGVADDTAAIKASIHRGTVHIGYGQFNVSEEIRIINQTTIIGSGHLWNSNPVKNTVIKYVGPANDSIAVFRASASPVGVNPSSATTNVRVENLILDGGDIIGYGLYCAYATNESFFEKIATTGTTQHGFWIGKIWYAAFRDLLAINNSGCGITIGRESFGWDAPVNGVYFANLRAKTNGTDNTWNQDTKIDWGYGIGLFTANHVTLRNITSETNYGPGLYMFGPQPISGVHGAYLEGNNETAGGSWPFGIIYDGHPNARGHFLKNLYMHRDATNGGQGILLTGSNTAGNLEIDNAYLGDRVYAEIDTYTLTNVANRLRNYIYGSIPNNRVAVSYNDITLYVSSTGDDTSDGRSNTTPFATLAKALQKAQYVAGGVVKIEVIGDIVGDDYDLSGYEFPDDLVIDGVGTANVTTSLTLRNNNRRIILQNFDSLARVEGRASKLSIVNSTVSLNDGSAAPAVAVYDFSDIKLTGCTLTGINSTYSYPSGINVSDSFVRLDNTTLSNFYEGTGNKKYVVMSNGTIISDVDLAAFGKMQWDNGGMISTNTKIYLSGGVITAA